MRSLTGQQSKVLQFVASYQRAYGFPPSIREIGAALGLSSSSTVASHLEALGRKGYLTRDPRRPRTLTLTEKARQALEPAPEPVG